MLTSIEPIKVAELLSAYYPATYADGCARKTHGMDHATRAALFGCAAYNLMTLSQSHGTDQLSFEKRERECRLVCIALLMHDSARQNDGPDLWDEASALNLFCVLNAHVELNLAKIVAEAMANKDWKADKEYSSLDINEPVPRFVKATRSHPLDPQTERLRLAIQFGDCIDIFRPSLRMTFDWTYIDLYRETQNIRLKEVIEELLPECFELIDKTEAQKISENWSADKLHEHVFQELNRDNQQAYPLLQSLFEPKKDFSFEQLPLTTDPIVRAFIQKNLLFRGVTDPTETYSRGKNEKPKQYSLTRAAYEIYKTERRENTPTEARTESKRLGKHGNRNRSTTLIGQGGSIFTEVGGGIFLDRNKVIHAFAELSLTGIGKRNEYNHLPRGDFETFEIGLTEIRKQMFIGENYVSGKLQLNNEVLCDIDHWDSIMYCVDENNKFKNTVMRRFIEAIHLRKRYQEQFKDNEPLALYQFSGRTGICKKVTVTDESILTTFISCFHADIQRMARAPRDSKEMDFVTNENLDIHEIFEHLYGNSLLKGYTEDFKLKIVACLKSDNSKIVRAIENILMEELKQRPRNENEEIYHLARLIFQMERGIELSGEGNFGLRYILRYFFDHRSTYRASPWVDLFAQIAKHTQAKSVFLQNLQDVSPRRFNDYLRLMSIVSPETVDDIDLVKMTREYIQKRVEDIKKYKISPLPSIERCIEEYGPVSFGPYYTEEMHQQIVDTLRKEEQVLLLRPLREFLEHYSFKLTYARANFALPLDVMNVYPRIYSKSLPCAEAVIESALISIFHDDNVQNTIMSDMGMLFKIHYYYPLIYASKIENIFRKSMIQMSENGERFIHLRASLCKIICVNTLFQAMTLFTSDTEGQKIDLLCKLVLRMVERNIWCSSCSSSSDFLDGQMHHWLNRAAHFTFGDFYTEEIHSKVMTKLESNWNDEIDRIFKSIDRPHKKMKISV